MCSPSPWHPSSNLCSNLFKLHCIHTKNARTHDYLLAMEHLYYYKAKPKAVGVTRLTQKKMDRPLKQKNPIAAGKLIFKVEMGIVVKRTNK